ncbi:hypothetical protein SAMN05216575_105151 [Ectopseudomonas alcaliphila]|jgi:hypothetical protein|uniref:Uncharacterized protein n=1 Tax=Ectopseudomonas alcaliphila TaxID=101564 RepID=A0A1G7HPK5_9GAMM|nr:hypothetical protein SAMN05216575_105151 [Pseudomonas alcaliphila]
MRLALTYLRCAQRAANAIRGPQQHRATQLGITPH